MTIGQTLKLFEASINGRQITLEDSEGNTWGIATVDGNTLTCDRPDGKFIGHICPMTGTAYLKCIALEERA